MLLWTSLAHAQAAEGKPMGAAPPASPLSAAEATPALTAAEKRLADVEERLAAIESAQSSSERDDSKNLFRIYGFTDMGVQRTWISEKSVIAPYIASSNATNFVVGNLNLYLDAQPGKDWRFLGEVHFSNAPGGTPELSTRPPPAGAVARLTERQYGYPDPAQPDGTYVFGGLVSIERAHIDWTHFSQLKVRVGQFFTPFGVYNVDHGTPVLITTKVPFFISSRLFPTRQTGIMLYGSTFVGPWELGYSAYVSNGRTDLAPITFDDNRGFGGRISAANEQSGTSTMKFGASFYTGRVSDEVIDITIGPSGSLSASGHSTYSFREYIGGVDASLDIGSTRLRLEAAVGRKVYDPGAREPVLATFALNATTPNTWTTSAYAIAAHRLSFLNLEPYLTGTYHRTAWAFGDPVFEFGGGLNVYLTDSVIFRSQLARAWFSSIAGTADTEKIAPQQDVTTAMSRLIMSF